MDINFLLPMKGHSERVPDKNMKPFRGAPLYHSIMKELHKSRFRGKIYVDTDSLRIADDLRNSFPDVIIIDRPEELHGDDVSMNRIISHDLSIIPGDDFFQTHSTNPLLSAATIDRAIDLYFMNRGKYDSLFGVNKILSRLYRADGTPVNHDPENLIKTQDLPPFFEENSNLYIFSRASFMNAGQRRIGKKPFMFETPRIESLDIDIQADFDMALFLHEYLTRDHR